jgi:hypothetical protein
MAHDPLEKFETIRQLTRSYVWTYNLRPLLTTELVAEHREFPFGPHSPALEMLVGFLRSDVDSAKAYIVICVDPDALWAIGEYSHVSGTSAPIRLLAERFDSIDSAEHDIFLRRLQDLGWHA